LTYHHSSLIEKIETVRAFHFGTSFLVEVHIVLPATMLVGEAHDIAEGLQQKIERLPEVERVSSRIFFIFIYLVHFIGIRPYRS
jgi:divalent metal cation (Fe/Co/Zn/Cd) transporter